MENQFATRENKSSVTKTYVVFSVFVSISFLVGMSLDIKYYAAADFIFIPIFLLPHTILFFIWLVITLSKKIRNPFSMLVVAMGLGLGYAIFCYFMVLAVGLPFRNYENYGTMTPSWEDQHIPRIK